MERFAVIDTETNWSDQIMSIGVVIADGNSLCALDSRYYMIPTACAKGGMYYDALLLRTPVQPIRCTRTEAMRDLRSWFKQHGVTAIFAYNAAFDRNHLRELQKFQWFDIMRLAAYRQHNPKIPATAECCSTGRLKRGYSVESILRMLSGNTRYQETHNAYFDALDELKIMTLLGHKPEAYPPL